MALVLGVHFEGGSGKSLREVGVWPGIDGPA